MKSSPSTLPEWVTQEVKVEDDPSPSASSSTSAYDFNKSKSPLNIKEQQPVEQKVLLTVVQQPQTAQNRQIVRSVMYVHECEDRIQVGNQNIALSDEDDNSNNSKLLEIQRIESDYLQKSFTSSREVPASRPLISRAAR